MSDRTEEETTIQAEAAERYGDVALGVECAWPESIPRARVAETESP
jgi:hypothetical protein